MSREIVSEQEQNGENKQKSQVEKKLEALWSDKRSWSKRLSIAASVVFCVCFMFVFFGPIEMVAFNASSLTFQYSDIALLLGIVAFVLFIVLTMDLSLLKGKIFNYSVSTIFAATVCGYIQANFLNGDLGALTGDAIDWNLLKPVLFSNLAVWVFVFLAVLFVLYLSRKIWERIVIFVSLALTVMQLVPCIGIFVGAYDGVGQGELSGYYFSTEGLYEYSSAENVLVFLLDRLDYEYIDEVLADDPDFFEKLDGFTAYTNAISTYARTSPAANHLLTGYEEGAYHMPSSEYFTQSWTADGKDILGDLDQKNYNISIYSEIATMFGNGKSAEQYVENVTNGAKDIDQLKMLGKMMSLSCYRYFPVAYKPFFWSDTNYYNTDIYRDDVNGTGNKVYLIDEATYAEGFRSITAEMDENCFKFYHFNGSHSPYYLNADGTKSTTMTSSLEQTKGDFSILYQIFDRMKELGIYDDATIIITADHGDAISDYEKVLRATRIGLFYKPSGSSGSPLAYSAAQVSTQNIPATLIKEIGGDYTGYGRPLDEIGEDEEIVRVYYKTVQSRSTNHEAILYTYNVYGDASDFDNWVIVETEEIEYPFY